jgi:hypothetical protein
VINDLREAIFAIALPTPPAPITSAFMGVAFRLVIAPSGHISELKGRLSIPLTFAKHIAPYWSD